MDMYKKVLISVKTIQLLKEENREEEMELITEGEFFKEEDMYVVKYEESEISGMDGTKTTIEISNDKVSLIREGTNNSILTFVEDESYVALYNTPHGTFEIGVVPTKVDVNINENGGEVELSYDVVSSGLSISSNDLNLSIKEIK